MSFHSSYRASRVSPAPAVVATSGTTIVFNGTNNPLSGFLNGQTDGGMWQDSRQSGGRAYATGFAGDRFEGTAFDDDLAWLNSSFSMGNQFIEGIYYRTAGYTPTTNHETSLYVASTMTLNNAQGYEILWNAQDGECNIVLWNGPLGSFNAYNGATGPLIGIPADGDILRAERIAGVIKVYKNNNPTPVNTAISDTTWTSGSPGIGFWPKNDASVILNAFGLKQIRFGSLP